MPEFDRSRYEMDLALAKSFAERCIIRFDYYYTSLRLRKLFISNDIDSAYDRLYETYIVETRYSLNVALSENRKLKEKVKKLKKRLSVYESKTPSKLKNKKRKVVKEIQVEICTDIKEKEEFF